jgi:hypothetical protein
VNAQLYGFIEPREDGAVVLVELRFSNFKEAVLSDFFTVGDNFWLPVVVGMTKELGAPLVLYVGASYAFTSHPEKTSTSSWRSWVGLCWITHV